MALPTEAHPASGTTGTDASTGGGGIGPPELPLLPLTTFPGDAGSTPGGKQQVA